MQTDTSILKLDTNLIIPNKYQPRKVFDEASLTSLSESIKTYGIINPILVRKKDDKYEIIAGERRFRAAQKAGLKEVPVIVKTANEQQMAELALIENIQRQGLNPIEEAKSYEEIMRIGNQTQASLAEKLGKSQSAIANKIRLLSLPQEIQDALANKKISERHARSLITVEDKDRQLELLNRIMKEKLTVKETEQIINESEISEEEIKQAISDIMKSLNIKEDEKEDDNMNNGNFFPNFDNNNAANNNASLNMMNMQSMNQQPMQPEPEMVMPSEPVDMGLQLVTPEPAMTPFGQFGATPTAAPETNINNNFNPMDSFMNQPSMVQPTQQENLLKPTMPTTEPPMMNEVPQFGPQLEVPTIPVDMEPQPVTEEVPVMAPPMEDVPLFNPNVVMPSVNETIQEPQMNQFDQFGPTPIVDMPQEEPQLVVSEAPVMTQNSFEVPLSNPEPLAPPVIDRLNELQDLLTANGYNYKVYSNETDNCVIIELPRN